MRAKGELLINGDAMMLQASEEVVFDQLWLVPNVLTTSLPSATYSPMSKMFIQKEKRTSFPQR